MRHFSTVPFSGTKEQEEQLTTWLQENKDMPGVVMPALQKAQEIYGYLPIEVQRMVAEALDKPLAGNLRRGDLLLPVQPLAQGPLPHQRVPGHRLLCKGQRRIV